MNEYVIYEAVGAFKTKTMKFSLKAYQSFAVLSDAQDFLCMLKRGGCTNLVIWRVKEQHAEKKRTKVR